MTAFWSWISPTCIRFCPDIYTSCNPFNSWTCTCRLWNAKQFFNKAWWSYGIWNRNLKVTTNTLYVLCISFAAMPIPHLLFLICFFPLKFVKHKFDARSSGSFICHASGCGSKWPHGMYSVLTFYSASFLGYLILSSYLLVGHTWWSNCWSSGPLPFQS